MNQIPKSKTKFIRVKCQSCGNEQAIFESASTTPKCQACNTILAETTGTKIRLKAEKIKDLN